MFQNIVGGTHGSAPYVVFGPPGTGKTRTLVAALLAVIRSNPESCVLVCAPSNAAADVIVERAKVQLNTSQMIRINAYSRTSEVPVEVKPYCSDSSNVPDVPTILRYRVVVTTCTTAARMSGFHGFPNDHFTHIMIDEAGHATEPECVASMRADCQCDMLMVCSFCWLGL